MPEFHNAQFPHSVGPYGELEAITSEAQFTLPTPITPLRLPIFSWSGWRHGAGLQPAVDILRGIPFELPSLLVEFAWIIPEASEISVVSLTRL